MTPTPMSLKISLPFQTFAKAPLVSRLVAEGWSGSFGLLPRRLDCVCALVPGILTYETETEGETYVAVDHGVLVKFGSAVLVSVRRALAGTDLEQLRRTVEQEYTDLDDNEQNVRAVVRGLEAGFLRRLASLQHE